MPGRAAPTRSWLSCRIRAAARRWSNRRPSTIPRSSVSSSAVSANNESTSSLQRCSKRTRRGSRRAPRTPAGGPASSGYSVSRRWAKPCSVVERGVVELVEGRAAAGACAGVGDPLDGARRRGLEAGPDAVAQLGGRGLGERDRGELAQLHAPGRDERDDAVDQRGRLARAGARLDEDADVVVVAHPRACRGVDRGRHSSSPSSLSSSSSYRRST